MPTDMSFPLTPEQEALRARARELADTVFADRAARWDATEEYPWDNVKDLAAAGFMGMTMPAAHGGGERPLLDVVLVIEQIARACGITGRIVVEGNLGVVGALTARLIRHRWAFAALCFALGFAFSSAMDLWHWYSFWPHTWEALTLVYAQGVWFSAAHAVGNVVFALVIGPELRRLLERYGRRLRVAVAWA